MSSSTLKLATVAFFVAGFCWSRAQAEFSLNSDVQGDRTVETLTVQITVAPEGDDLEEPVALDLGLGFPFWLHPLGRETSESVPFGAIPQEGAESNTVPAGSSATFTFRLEGESGQDILLTSPQLLAGVRVSDIARIGFVSRGLSDWELAAYEIRINGQAFAANDTVNLKVKDAQDEARFQIADLGVSMGPIGDELSDLNALIEAELADDIDQQRATDLESELATLEIQARWFEGQVLARYPWFAEPEFRSPWRKESSITEAAAIVVTDTHAGADTNNHVYFSTGGQKYALIPSVMLLEGQLGSQRFELDLLGGPLTAADFRGYAVGMLAHGHPYGDAPDRWHPQRLLVELDGRLVYDSDESPIDRNSLDAIRVIPPAHLNALGELVANTPNARETYLWEAGKGAGLDLDGGGVLPLPPPDDPSFPEPESGVPGNGGIGGGSIGGGGIGGGSIGGGSIGGGSIGGGGIGGGGIGGGPGSGGLWLEWLVSWLLSNLPPLPPGTDPPTLGPFGIDSVRIAQGWKYDDEFAVEWTISGDENEIDHYDVFLVHVQPDQPMPFRIESPLPMGSVPRGNRSITAQLPSILVGAPTLEFAAPVVVAVPTDPNQAPFVRPGPARPVFPIGTEPFAQPNLRPQYFYGQMLSPKTDTVKLEYPKSATDRAVWVPGQIESHNAILFDDPKPAMHVVMRPEPGDEMMAIKFQKADCTGRNRVAAYVGFVGGAGGDSEVEVFMSCAIGRSSPSDVKVYPPKVVTLKAGAGGSPAPMVRIEQVVDQADLTTPFNYKMLIALRFRMKKVDPAHPPAVFGLGMIAQ